MAFVTESYDYDFVLDYLNPELTLADVIYELYILAVVDDNF